MQCILGKPKSNMWESHGIAFLYIFFYFLLPYAPFRQFDFFHQHIYQNRSYSYVTKQSKT